MSKCFVCEKELENGDGICDECKEKLENICVANVPDKYKINHIIEPHIIIRCLICGEETKRLHRIMSETQTIDICDKCKKAVMKMREETDGN